jgi:hydrogenase maturation protease
VPVAVIGIGQSMRGDDAAGLEAVRLWQSVHPETAQRADVRIGSLEGSGLELIELLQGMDAAVLVDAVCSDAPAGAVQRIDLEALSSMPGDSAAAHGWGVGDALRLASALEPEIRHLEIRLLGVETGRLGVGEGLSEAVKAALPALCEAIEEQVGSLLRA